MFCLPKTAWPPTSSEPTARGTGLARSAGKEDPVEFDSSLVLWSVSGGVA